MVPGGQPRPLGATNQDSWEPIKAPGSQIIKAFGAKQGPCESNDQGSWVPTKADAHLGGLFKRDWPHIFHVVFLLQIRKSMPFLSQDIFGHLGQKIWIMRWELKFLYLCLGSRSCIFLVPVSRCMYIYHVPFDNRTQIHFFLERFDLGKEEVAS